MKSALPGAPALASTAVFAQAPFARNAKFVAKASVGNLTAAFGTR